MQPHSGMDRDGLEMAKAVVASPTDDPVLAQLEAPQDTAAHRRAQTRFPYEFIFFILCTTLLAFNLGAHWELALEIGNISVAANLLTLTGANVTGLVAEYNALIAANPENVDRYCDAPYFAANGFGNLQTNLDSLKQATLAIFYIGVFPSVAYVIYKIAIIRELWHMRKRSLLDTWTSQRSNRRQKNAFIDREPNNSPIGILNIGDVTVAGQIRLAERHGLRGETTGYFLVQMMHDIPLVLIFFLFLAYVDRYRGYNCALCFVNNQLCTVPYYFSLTFTDNYTLKVAMGACFLHIAWIYVTLTIRWMSYFQTFVPPWACWKKLLCWLLSTIIAVASFLTPVAIFFVVYIGPTYYGFSDLTTGIAISVAGGGVWAIGLIVFFCVGGLGTNESCTTGVFCCDFCQLCWFAIPFIDYIDQAFGYCGFDSSSCCCCC